MFPQRSMDTSVVQSIFLPRMYPVSALPAFPPRSQDSVSLPYISITLHISTHPKFCLSASEVALYTFCATNNGHLCSRIMTFASNRSCVSSFCRTAHEPRKWAPSLHQNHFAKVHSAESLILCSISITLPHIFRTDNRHL